MTLRFPAYLVLSGLLAQFTSGVNLVEVYVSVTAPSGEPVLGLSRDDFEVYENGERQTIGAFAAGEFPLSVALAVDRSFSMAGERLTLAVSAARAFLDELAPTDRAMIVAIGSEIETLAPLSVDRAAQLEALKSLTPWGTTGLHDAIIQSIDAVQPGRGRRALIVLSDGTDRFSHASAADVLSHARKNDVMVYPIALGPDRSELFAELAALTGGRSFHERNPKALTPMLHAIAQELRHQYLLGYTPTRPLTAGSGEWRSIEVKVRRSGAAVRARDGYLVK